MELSVVEGREEISSGEGKIAGGLEAGLPFVIGMHEHNVAVVGERKISLEETLAGLII